LIAYGMLMFIVSAVVGGFWWYQRSVVSSLEKRIENLIAENETLKLERQKNLMTIETLNRAIIKKENEIEEILKELEKNRRIVEDSQKRLETALNRLQDYERRERVTNLLKSRKRELILKYLNDNIQCWIENFDKVGGECIQGKWVERK